MFWQSGWRADMGKCFYYSIYYNLKYSDAKYLEEDTNNLYVLVGVQIYGEMFSLNNSLKWPDRKSGNYRQVE